jgi:hypothetical protein
MQNSTSPAGRRAIAVASSAILIVVIVAAVFGSGQNGRAELAQAKV